jgi:hypothetical protein
MRSSEYKAFLTSHWQQWYSCLAFPGFASAPTDASDIGILALDVYIFSQLKADPDGQTERKFFGKRSVI